MSTPQGQSALILGATGQTGRYLLKELLSSSHFTRVGEYGRKVTPAQSITAGKEKLEQKTIDFEKLEDAGLGAGNWDVVFITLGTTRAAAGSAAAFEKIDREYVINAARAAKSTNSQRLVYVSSIGASSSSSFLYSKSKGLTEEGLAGLGYSDTIVFRPAMLVGTERPETRVAEIAASFITGVLSHVSSKVEIKVATLAKSVFIAGKLGSSGLPPAAQASHAGKGDATYTVIANPGALALAKTDE